MMLQVTKRSHQSSPAKPQTSANIPQQHSVSGNSEQDSNLGERQDDVNTKGSATQSRVPENHSPQHPCTVPENSLCSQSADNSSPLQKTERTNAAFRKTTNASKRLLAPSFFAKKS